jgi:hypothetical protein
MNRIFSRRKMGRFAAALAVPLAGGVSGRASAATTPTAIETFPAQAPDVVREMVTVAHGNIKRVKELVEARPSLAKAAMDWGFGDWEDALGAASHVGNPEIASYLIAHGARPTLYSATMFGQLEVVKAFLAAQPGAQRIPGPHGISLLAHAKNGGKPGDAVYQYLESLADAGTPPRVPLDATEAASLAAVYVFGTGASDRIEIIAKDTQLIFVRQGTTGRPLNHLGEHAFSPAGAEAVRIRFTGSGKEGILTVHDPDEQVRARRLN